ncbi:helix-turn-helix domain-containing protein [Olleya sp. UBA1516]|uniref:helix-turn-helix domain-containing protein n=1 Tax=Olleya sp. UBA1516 TaxID=1947013 RepID=UPI0039C9F172|tara:strand:- start:2660 stop:3004 length:345 start_codon:yes stop_codon:yes gene_type:complete
MHTKSKLLSHYRKDANLPLHDVAFLLGIDKGNLSKVERGMRQANPNIYLLYHMLFGVPLNELFAEQMSLLKNNISKQSQILVDELNTCRPPRSTQRVQFIESFVNNLSKDCHES